METNPQIDQLHHIVLSLRHQLNVKSFALQNAEAEIARLAEAYSNVLLDHNTLEEKHGNAQKRIDELELHLNRRDHGAHHKNVEKPHHHRQESKAKNNETSKTRPVPRKFETDATQTDDCLTDKVTVIELPDDDARLKVLTRIPEMPADIIMPRLADVFLAPDFDFIQWIATNGLQLPSSIRVLSSLTWEDRLRLSSEKMKEMGITNPEDRSYILRVFKAIAEGEVSTLLFFFRIVSYLLCSSLAFTRAFSAISSLKNNTCASCVSNALTSTSPISLASRGLAVCSSTKRT